MKSNSIEPVNAGPVAISRRAFTRMLAGAITAVAGSVALAQATLGSGPVEDAIRNLKPGEFLWAPDVAPSGPVLVIVSLEAQRAYVYRNGVLIAVSTASTGKAGHDTPTDLFTILQKRVDHKSNLYDDAPMPFMQRLTWTGVAMHAGNLPGYPASHGCIRLPLDFARNLYGISRLGMTVVITGSADVPRIAPTPRVLEDSSPGSSDGTGIGTTWKPEQSPSGPLSIIISGADRRMLVLRNGIIIGSAPVTMAEAVTAPRAFSLRSAEGGIFHWMQLPLPGQTVTDADITATDGSGLSILDDFRRTLRSVLTPGTTVVVTPDTLARGSTGQKLTVLAGQNAK